MHRLIPPLSAVDHARHRRIIRSEAGNAVVVIGQFVDIYRCGRSRSRGCWLLGEVVVHFSVHGESAVVFRLRPDAIAGRLNQRRPLLREPHRGVAVPINGVGEFLDRRHVPVAEFQPHQGLCAPDAVGLGASPRKFGDHRAVLDQHSAHARCVRRRAAPRRSPHRESCASTAHCSMHTSRRRSGARSTESNTGDRFCVR